MAHALAKRKRPPARIVSDASVMGGRPIIQGTRVPADVIIEYLRAGRAFAEVFEDYPSLPVDGIDAVIAWAEETLGSDCRTEKISD